MGIPQAEVVAARTARKIEPLGIWPENWRPVCIASGMHTQWRMGPAGPIGWDYNALPIVDARIDVPAGFETDFASVPFAARWYVDSTDPDILFPAIVHDWLYQNRGQIEGRTLSREQSDGVLREAMQAIGAPALKTRFAYRAVRLGGWHAWRT